MSRGGTKSASNTLETHFTGNFADCLGGSGDGLRLRPDRHSHAGGAHQVGATDSGSVATSDRGAIIPASDPGSVAAGGHAGPG